MTYLKISLLLLSLFHSVAMPGQEPRVTTLESNVRSALLGKELKHTVCLPRRYAISGKRYPVLYVLHSTVKTVEEVASICQNLHQEKRCPELIVLGIDAGNDNPDGMTDPADYDAFLSYLEKELIPETGQQYRTNGQRILYEKSLSGSFALYALLTQPALFNGYIAASKQWYDENNEYFTALANTTLQNPQPFAGKKIFLATLNGAYNNNNIPEVDRQMLEFSKTLTSKSGNAVSAAYQAFDDWNITPQPGFAEGLLFVSAKRKSAPAKTDPLSMKQTANGKWVILDGQKKEMYEVFAYDNGPDYPAEGLIRIVKNGKIGYADATTYALVIAPQFDCAYPFENGKAKVSKQCQTLKDGEHSTWASEAWQYVDKQGNFKK